MTWRIFVKSCIACYREVVGPNVSLRNYSTPFLAEDHKDALAGAPGAGPVRECPWCYHTEHPATFAQHPSVGKLPVRRKVKAETSADSDVGEEQSVATGKKPILDEGALASVACSLLMKGAMGRTACTPGSFTSSQPPSNQGYKMDVQM